MHVYLFRRNYKGCQYACHPLPGRGSDCPYVYLTVPDDRQGCQVSISKWFEEQKIVVNRYLPFGEQEMVVNSCIVC